MQKDRNFKDITNHKGIIKNYNIIIKGKNLYDEPTRSDTKRYRYEDIRKSTKGQGENCAAVYLLDYEYLKNYCRLKAVDLSLQGELVADPKAM